MNLLEKIREAVKNIASMAKDELAALRADVIKCAKEYDGESTTENVAILNELADIGDAVKARQDEIVAEETQAQEQADAARARLQGLGDPEGSEGEPSEGDSEGDGDATPEGATEPSGEPVAASSFRSNASRMRAVGSRTVRSPELGDPTVPRIRVIAASALPGKNVNDEFHGSADLASVMAQKLTRLDRRSANGRVLVASALWSDLYPEARRLHGDTSDVEKLSAGFREFAGAKKGLVASGGVPLPTNVDYAEDTWAVADRPIRAGLDPYAVDRGGLLFRQPPTLAALADATTIWTNANDIDPTDPTTKPVLQITAPDTTQVFIDAVPTRLGFGNLMGQFDPETIAANTDLAIAAAARIAELNLLSGIADFATDQGVTKSQVMGASRDLFQTIIQVVAAYRFQFRLARDLPLSIILPTWALDIIKADRVWELAHDSAGSFNPFSVTDEVIEGWFDAYNVDPIWTLDGLPANTTVSPNYVSQNFTAFTQGDAAPAFPTELFWLLFIKGSVQFLDGGRLDLGVVRDATLDATNDYETFVETFENVANRGFPGSVVSCVSSLLPTGASSEGISA